MLMCCSDGGLVDEANPNKADIVLPQRAFVHEALSQKLHVALLDTVEFKDSKVLIEPFQFG